MLANAKIKFRFNIETNAAQMNFIGR